MKKTLKVLFFIFFVIPLLFIVIGAFFSDPDKKYENHVSKFAKTTLNVRKYPKLDGEILKVLNTNEKVIVYDSVVNGFTLILSSDSTKYGWASKNYLQNKELSKNQLEKIKEQEEAELVELTKKTNEKARFKKQSNKEGTMWYDGGTLHKLYISDWKLATNKNKIATCADYIAAVTGSTSLTEIKLKATQLKICIDEATIGLPSTDDEKISDVAIKCIILLGYK